MLWWPEASQLMNAGSLIRQPPGCEPAGCSTPRPLGPYASRHASMASSSRLLWLVRCSKVMQGSLELASKLMFFHHPAGTFSAKEHHSALQQKRFSAAAFAVLAACSLCTRLAVRRLGFCEHSLHHSTASSTYPHKLQPVKFAVSLL